MAWLLRRRLFLSLGLAATVAVYLALVQLVQQAVLQAARPQQQQQQPPPTSRRALPTITGYSAEMKFRSAARFQCPSAARPAARLLSINNDLWQRVAAPSRLYLFSAHWDDRLHVGVGSQRQWLPFVRLLGMTEGRLNETAPSLYCQLWSSDPKSPPLEVVAASVNEIWLDVWDPGAGRRSYRPYLVSCPSKTRPTSVSLVPGPDPCSPASTLLRVGGSRPDEEQPQANTRGEFAVCVKGLDFEEDISSRLVEWIELYLLLGAERFTFYELRTHPNVARVLAHYEQRGVVERRPLTLPGSQPNEPDERSRFLRRQVWQKRRNELVPYNDCFYRHMRRFRFVVPVDVDEVIVPVRHSNWSDLIGTLEKEDPNLLLSHASLSAQQIYFFDEGTTPLTSAAAPTPAPPSYMYLLGRTKRTSDFSRAGHGVKSFVVTANCLTVFNHYALDVLQPGTRRDVILPSRLVQLNHYKRRCPPEIQRECHSYLAHMVTDTLLLQKYIGQLEPRVTRTLHSLRLI